MKERWEEKVSKLDLLAGIEVEDKGGAASAEKERSEFSLLEALFAEGVLLKARNERNYRAQAKPR